jgi:hypothetical protein
MSSDTCQNCKQQIRIAIFRGSGYCSENCRKALAAAEASQDVG